jgi:hypothetical protein
VSVRSAFAARINQRPHDKVSSAPAPRTLHSCV